MLTPQVVNHRGNECAIKPRNKVQANQDQYGLLLQAKGQAFTDDITRRAKWSRLQQDDFNQTPKTASYLDTGNTVAE